VIIGKMSVSERYEIGQLLGKGAFSSVFEAVHKASQQRVAIKIIDKAHLKAKDLEAVGTEIRILKSVDHPNVLKLYEHYDDAFNVCLVLELCDGGELFDRISKREYYTESDARQVLLSVGSALKHCHDRKIVHRDLKPENILLLNEADDAPIKIADFGFAKVIEEDALTSTLGTPNYVAPEILERRPYDAAVDMWSYGVITYILLSGFPPFFGDTNPEIYKKVRKCDYQFEAPYWDNVSPEAKDLISNLLVLNPQKRFTIDQVLSHPWMTSSKLDSKDITPALAEMRSTLARHRLKRGIGAVVALNHLKNLVKRHSKEKDQ
jgi:calcium/calmodulin-dependent protein kinase I